MYQDVLHDCKLLDLSFSKGKYTWSNNKLDQTFTKEKLDRAIASDDWISTFGDGDF